MIGQFTTDRDAHIRELVTEIFPGEDDRARERRALEIIWLLDTPEDKQGLDAIQRGFVSTRTIVRFRWLSMRMLDTVWAHQDRIAFMPNFSGHLIAVSFPQVDMKKLGFQWRNHDASEGISPLGDIPTNQKAALSDTHKGLLQEIDLKISALLARLHYTEYYNEPGRLREIFMELQEKTSLESWIVKWFDIIDAYMVVLRELEAGNGDFDEVYGRHLATMRDIRDGRKYPEIGSMLASLRFDETRAYIEDLFEDDDWMKSHFLASFALFRIDDFAQDVRRSDGSLVLPRWYTVWSEKIDRIAA